MQSGIKTFICKGDYNMKILKVLKKIFLSPIKYAQSIGVSVGKNCKFYHNITWGSEPYLIEIGDYVRITNGVSFITHDGGVWVLRNLKFKKEDINIDVFKRIKIGNNVHIGWNAIIMGGVTIGNNCIIGAGAVVTKDVPNNTIVAGVPAKKIKSVDEYYEKIKKNCDYTKGMNSKEKKKYLYKKFKISNNKHN